MKSAGDVAHEATKQALSRRRLDELGRGVARARRQGSRYRDCRSARLHLFGTDEAQAASLANIDDFLGYVINFDEFVKMLKR